MSSESENPVNRVIVGAITANDKGTSGEPINLDSLMEEAGGEALAQWWQAEQIGRTWDAYEVAELVYWATDKALSLWDNGQSVDPISHADDLDFTSRFVANDHG